MPEQCHSPSRDGCGRLYLAYTIGAVIAALGAMAMTIISIGVNATQGSLIDETGISNEDWTTTGLFAALSLILVPMAVFRIRRARRASP